ncbi:tRNA (adenine(22)-N(1))-methyltransferase TrmK [Paenisporosarcina sp. TG20]|uniref:tRNA (adenine(22)-N(1))-methyltransferase n=1 Tax=Paenisporosarcina sp. TG20 TaxID=1211706 RepID=UPI00031A0A48|nr:tRNA (adenine(22)-N(1))-methyltransferase TrmK [Paenisporosarcina sp. TG20]
MNAQRLSDRLTRVASYVQLGSIVADIGSDHAYLPCYLIHHQIAKKAVAGEVAKGPYESAQRQVLEEQLDDKIEVRLANGLSAIAQDDLVDTVTIAGMGGPLITTILDQGFEKLKTVNRLILQPNIHAKAIREWAMTNGWNLIAEEILLEEDKIYEILVLERGEMKLSEAQTLLGPFLMEARNEAFYLKWSKESAEWNRILGAIRIAQSSREVQMKKEEIEEKLKIVKEAISK